MRPSAFSTLLFASVCLSATFSNAQQVVYLDFDSATTGGEHMYTTSERNQIQALVEDDYANFNFLFTQSAPTSGSFSTLTMNSGPSLGLADGTDFRNQNPNDDATINVNGAAFNSAQFVTLTASTVAHELGHLAGLRHGDSFGPLGSGIDPNTLSGSAYLPTYNGPTGADETRFHLMESDNIFIENTFNQFFSERSAIKLAFNEGGTVVAESAADKGSITSAQALSLGQLIVPNTLDSGDRAGLGDFDVDALVVTGAINTIGQNDFFSFEGEDGDLFNFEVISQVLNRFGNPIDPEITLLDSIGNPVDYFGVDAFNDQEFESADSILIDIVLPDTGTYYVQVNAFSSFDTGNYELFMHRFNGIAVPEPSAVGLLGLFALVGTSAFRRRRRS